MTAKLHPNPVFRAVDANGDALVGGLVYTYAPGTTDLKATYKDSAAATPHANPIILDSRGEEQIYWGTGNYKIIIKDSSDVTIDTIDPFDPQVEDAVNPSDNKVVNGSFEADSDSDGTPDNWTLTAYTNGTIARDTAENAHGAASLKCTSPGGTGNGGGWASGDQFAVSENVAVLASVETKSSVAGVHSKAEMRFFTAAGSFLSSSTLFDLNGGNPTSWTLYRSALTPPSTARHAAIYVYGCIDDNTTAGTTWFDNCVVRDADLRIPGVQTLTASATLSVDDQGLILVGTSGGAVTLTLPTDPAGGTEYLIVRTDATNTLTITRGGTNTIDRYGTSATLSADNDTLTLIFDGTSEWRVTSRITPQVDTQTFTASGTWTKPTWGVIKMVRVRAWGGGGGGGIQTAGGAKAGGGGGGGAFVEVEFDASTLSATETVTIGAGGAGAAGGGGTAGASGLNTTFGAHLTAYGGGGGGASTSLSVAGAGGGGGGALSAGGAGTVAGTSIAGVGGEPGASAAATSNAGHGGGGGGDNTTAPGGASFTGGGGGGAGTSGTTGVGGASFWGGGGGGGGNGTGGTGSAGGLSVMGGNGGTGSSNESGVVATNGSQPGGGGGGSEALPVGVGDNAGDGGDGQVVVTTIFVE
ncbi:MAG: hypothetical protein OEY97_07735 [Nitrospirota bacterium]|nr:hypothetical protein [Nitrospirota bacterium]